jgi:hypothetical protein
MKLNNETVYVSDYFIVKFIVVCSGGYAAPLIYDFLKRSIGFLYGEVRHRRQRLCRIFFTARTLVIPA